MWNALSFFSCHLAIGPYSPCQTGHGRSCFADALVDLHVESEGIRDGGSQVDI